MVQKFCKLFFLFYLFSVILIYSPQSLITNATISPAPKRIENNSVVIKNKNENIWEIKMEININCISCGMEYENIVLCCVC